MLRYRNLVLLSILSTVLCYSQVTVGRITGTVTDQSGAIVPGIAVTAEESSTGVTTQVTTLENGSYVFTSLPPGTYSLSVEKQGFTAVHQTGIVLDAASSRTINLILKTSTLAESVSVEATAEQVKTDSGDVSATIDNRKIDQIAMNGRNYYNLLNFLRASPPAR